MRTVVLLCLVLATPSLAQVVGGNPPRLLATNPDPALSVSAPRLVVTDEGTQFVAYREERVPIEDSRLIVLRSTDGGDRWQTWDVITDSRADGEPFRDIRLGRIDNRVDEQIVLAYSIRIERPDGSFDAQVRVQSADPADTTPQWTGAVALSEPGPVGSTEPVVIDFDMAVPLLGGTTVGIAALVRDQNGLRDRWIYTVASQPDGDYSAARTTLSIRIASSPSTVSETAVAVHFHDETGARSVTVIQARERPSPPPGPSGDLRMFTATNRGFGGNFGSSTEVFTTTFSGPGVDLAADPESDAMVVAGWDGQLPRFNFGGQTFWSSIDLADDGTLITESVRYDRQGFAVVGWRAADVPELVEYRPTGILSAPWEPRTLLRLSDDRVVLAPDSADDPTRPGGVATVAVSERVPGLDGTHLWYNGTWRSDPGYGTLLRATPQRSRGTFDSAPAIGDVDGDGDAEVVTTSDTGSASLLEIFDPTGGEDPERSTALVATAACSAPALVDVDADGDLEIFVGSARGLVEGFDRRLDTLPGWPVDLPGSGPTYVSTGSVEGSAPADVVAASGSQVFVLAPNGAQRDGWPFVDPRGGTVVGRVAIGDVDRDEDVEVVVALTTGVLILQSDGSIQRSLGDDWTASTGVSLADLDGDDDLEILVPTTDGRVVALEHRGDEVPGFPFDTRLRLPVSAIAASELRAPGERILSFTAGTQLFAVDAEGTLLAGHPFEVVAVGTTLSEPVVDRVFLGSPEDAQSIFGSSDGFAHVSTATGQAPLDWPRFLADGVVLPPAAGDVDADGTTEMAFVAGDELFVLGTGVTPRNGEVGRWTHSGHDRGRSGCAGCSTETATAVESGDAYDASLVDFRGVLPNPTSDTTTLSFALTRAATIEVEVFDARGRRVRTLFAGARPTGLSRLVWDANDDAGSPVASGTYFARVRVAGETMPESAVQRIVLLR